MLLRVITQSISVQKSTTS